MNPIDTLNSTIDELADEAARRQFANTVDSSEVDVDSELRDAWFIKQVGNSNPPTVLAEIMGELTDAQAIALFAAITDANLNVLSSIRAVRETLDTMIQRDVARDATLKADALCEEASLKPSRREVAEYNRASAASSRLGIDPGSWE